MSPGFGEVDGQLLLVRGPPLLQHQSEVRSKKVFQPDAAHEALHLVEPGRQLPHRLQAGLKLGERDTAILVGVKFVKERPQHVRFDALFPAKGEVPLVKRQVTGAINVGAGECGRGVLREESLQDGDGRLAAPPYPVALARVVNPANATSPQRLEVRTDFLSKFGLEVFLNYRNTVRSYSF